MSSKTWPLLLQVALCVFLEGVNFGCGSPSSNMTLQPPPPAIIVAVSPISSTVQTDGTRSISATVINDPANKGVNWTIACSTNSCGTVSPTSTSSGQSTTYTAPATAPAGSVTITATSAADPTKSASAAININATLISISISPSGATLAWGVSRPFTATVSGDSGNNGVTWSLSVTGNTCSNLDCGTISPASTLSGTPTFYTAPSGSFAYASQVNLTATSVTDPTRSSTILVNVVMPPISVSLSPSSVLIQVNGTVHFQAGVAYDPHNAGVTWSITGCTGGPTVCGAIANVSNSGPFTADYTAPATVPPGGNVTVVATSITDNTESASCVVTIGAIDFTAQNYPAGTTPYGVVVADFNGDGRPDIAVADYGNPSTGDNGGISILLGNGDGTFQAAILINAGKNPNAIAVGDFNNDGHEDLIVSNFGNRAFGGNGSVSVLLGNGDGTFQAPLPLSAGSEPFPLAVGDFNGDGKLDFAVSDYNAGVYIFLGNGDGTFQPSTLVSTGNNPSAIAAHDLNGDGKLDLAVAGTPLSGFNSSVNVLLGNGDGTFQSPVPYTLNQTLPTSIAIGDLNGDGNADLAATWFGCVFGFCTGGTSILLGNGDGTFQSVQAPYWTHRSNASLSAGIADLAGSGKADLIQINGGNGCSGTCVVVLLGNGDGTFAGPLFFGADQSPFALAIGDLNGDGKPDIVVANQASNDITVLLNETLP